MVLIFVCQDDTKVLLAKPEVSALLDTIQKQQSQFSDVPDQLPLDPVIPITFTKVIVTNNRDCLVSFDICLNLSLIYAILYGRGEETDQFFSFYINIRLYKQNTDKSNLHSKIMKIHSCLFLPPTKI